MSGTHDKYNTALHLIRVGAEIYELGLFIYLKFVTPADNEIPLHLGHTSYC